MNRKGQGIYELGGIVVIVALVFLILATFAYLNSKYSDSVDKQEISKNALILTRYNTSNSLGEIEEGITSFSATSPNLTWIDFNGINSTINVTGYSQLDFNNTDFTILIWAKSFSNSSVTNIFSSIGDASNKDFRTYFSTDGKIYFDYEWANGVERTTSSLTLYQLDKWYFIALTYNNSYLNYTTLYLNGVADKAQANAYARRTLNQPKYIGSALAGYLNGSVAYVSVLNKSLEPFQVDALYNQSKLGNDKGIGIPVVMYHFVGGADGNINIDLGNFTQQIAYLNSSGFKTITFRDYYNWQNGLATMPEKPIILTFDADGEWGGQSATIYTNASPVLDTYGYVGVIGVVTGDLGETGEITWAQINLLKNKGWEIASHSTNHSDFTGNTEEVRIAQFNDSYHEIIGNTSTTPITFIYPLSLYNSTIQQECLDNNYKYCLGKEIDLTKGVSRGYYLYKSYNRTNTATANDVSRLRVKNTTDLESFKKGVNLLDSQIVEYNFGSGTGTSLIDSQKYSANGTLINARWNNDGVNAPLTNNIDYLLSSNTLRILNPLLVYHGINISYTYENNTLFSDILDRSNTEIANNTSIAGIMLTISLIGIVLSILFGIFMNWKRGI